MIVESVQTILDNLNFNFKKSKLSTYIKYNKKEFKN